MTAYKAMYWDVQKKANQLKVISFLSKCSVGHPTMHCTLIAMDASSWEYQLSPINTNTNVFVFINHCTCLFFKEFFVFTTFFFFFL
jgi:hypothetical protein